MHTGLRLLLEALPVVLLYLRNRHRGIEKDRVAYSTNLIPQRPAGLPLSVGPEQAEAWRR